ncbi:PAS domain-containing protein, partial [Aquabacterium sp.]|uniref:PAS domain-containing hybrid sensor histidine kinase/response regulator n=1 Tax=Aquabacterium sp. TaxID=1872578 RepID=UPI0025C71E09
MTLNAAQEDAERLNLVQASQLLEGTPPPAFDALTRTAASLLQTPMATITLVDNHTVWYVTRVGLPGRQQTRSGSMCEQVITTAQPLFLTDPDGLAAAPHAKAYAGAPLMVEGLALGTLCVLDTVPRQWTPREQAALHDCALAAAALLSSQLQAHRFQLMEQRVRTASLAGSDWLWETNAKGQIQWVSASLVQHTGLAPSAEIGLRADDIYIPRDDETRVSWTRFCQARLSRAPFQDAIADRITPRGRITVSISGTPVFSSQGVFMGYRGASRNVTRQLATEQEARKADTLLRQAIESFHVGVMISAADGRILLHNTWWLDHVTEGRESIDTTWPDTIRRLYRQGAYAQTSLDEEAFLAWRLALHEHKTPVEVYFKKGWLLLKDHVLQDGSVVHFAMDITRNKLDAALLAQKQQALQETEARLSAVLKALPDLWLVFDAEGRYVDAHADHPMLMRPLHEVKGKPLGQAIPTEQAALQREAMREAQRTGLPQRLEYSLVTPDGVARHFEARMTPMPDGQTLFLTRDMTERQIAAEKLRISEERWKFALDGAGDGVWDYEVDTRTLFLSPQWKALLGHSDEELANDTDAMLSLVHPDDTERVRREFFRYLSEASGLYQSEFRMLHKEGHAVWILSRGKVVSRAHDGRPLRLVGTHSDITLLKQAEQSLRDKHAAEAASSAKSEFLSRMSHEIRTPLNAVNGFAHLLQLRLGQADADEGVLNYVSQIRQASQHLMGLVNDVLDLQQVETGKLSLRTEPLSLVQELRQCTDMLAPLAQGRDVSLVVQASQDATVLADAQRLRQAIMNIGSNAIKYNRPGGDVRFAIEPQPDGQFALCITDTGPGMTAAELARLYQPFERLGRETSSIEGTGLGLIITRTLIEAMQGRVDIRSQPEHGTTVRIILPAASPDPGLVATSPSTSPHPVIDMPTAQTSHSPAQALRVLYVEDNRINAMLFEEALRPYGQIALDIAEDGQTAVSLVQESPPQVLVLDAHLPGMSGFDVLKALRKLPGMASVPAYMCSADAMPEDVARAKAEGFTGYWTKPIDIVEVTTELCRLAA